MRSSIVLGALATLVTLGGCQGSDDAPAPTALRCTLAVPTLSSWRLRAEGRHFRDALGRQVLLRGVNAGTRSKWAPYMPFDFTPETFDAALAKFMDRAADWGLNVLRLPFTWAAVEPAKGVDDEVFLKRYDALVDAAWKRGIRVLVDFHQDVYAENFCGDGFPAWTLPDPSKLPAPHHDCAAWGEAYLTNADVRSAFDRFWADGSSVQKDYVALWTRMAARYKDRPGVIGFEPINEPNAGTAESGAFQKTTLRDFYARMTATLRGIAPETLVFVEPIGFDSGFASTKLEKPTGTGLVFAPHYYPLGTVSDDLVHNGLEKWATIATAWDVPVFVGEFGLAHGDRESADTIADLTFHYDAFDDLLMSGTQWEYSASVDDWNLEAMSLVHPDGTEWKLANALVRPYARATAGNDVVTRYDASKRTFTLTFTPDAEGISEVALPPRLSIADVDLSGGCVDASHPGVVLVKSAAAATKVQLALTLR